MNSKISLFTLLLVSRVSVTSYTQNFYSELAQRLWKNESGCSYEKLVWWNEGEPFMSLGIGHFIWYAKDEDYPFTQTFPELLTFLEKKGYTLPCWLADTKMACPWTQRNQVVQAKDKRLEELRSFLKKTMVAQAEYIVQRYEKNMQAIVKAIPVEQQEEVKKSIQLITATPQGLYALLDYVHFKGEGTNPKERYNGKGWGLVQVLLEVDTELVHKQPCVAFAQAAQKVLEQRVALSPKERNEKRWLAGWLNRVSRYAA